MRQNMTGAARRSSPIRHNESAINRIPLATWTAVANVPVPVNGQDTVALSAGEVQKFFLDSE